MKKKPEPKRHPHRWRVSSWTQNEVSFRCVVTNCSERRSRPMNARERRKAKKDFGSLLRETKKPVPGAEYQPDIHSVWHDFTRRFIRTEKGPVFKTVKGKLVQRQGKRLMVYGPPAEKYKYQGYDLMEAIRRWAEKFPREVQIIGCDDSYHSSSDLVLIEHRTRDAYMGTTVLFIAQCSGDPPAEFFLYPGHREGLIDALTRIKREERPILKRERARQRKENAFWRRAKPGANAKVS